MPTHRVIFTPRSVADLEAIRAYIAADSPDDAARVVGRLIDAAESLGDLPHRHPAAREARYFKRPLRQFVVRPYRIVYEVTADAVSVITIRHAKRRPLKPGVA